MPILTVVMLILILIRNLKVLLNTTYYDEIANSEAAD